MVCKMEVEMVWKMGVGIESEMGKYTFYPHRLAKKLTKKQGNFGTKTGIIFLPDWIIGTASANACQLHLQVNHID